MSRKQPTFALSLLSLFCLSLSFLLLVQFRGNPAAAQIPSTSAVEPDPFAIIKTIVVNGAEIDKADPPDATIVHAGTSSGAKPGMLLYVGDEVTTGEGVKLTILFLDTPAEKDNEVVIDSKTHVQLGSLFTWGGRILASVKGYFEMKSKRARWSVEGTEYELVVENGTNRLRVLKGAVRADTGNFSPTIAENEESDKNLVGPMFLPAAFREPATSSQKKSMEFVAVSGRVIKIDSEFILTNSCQRPHLYRVAAPVNLNWFQFMGADQFAINGNGTRTIRFAIRLDGTNVPVGVQESQIVFPCLDCNTEPGCPIGGLFLPITVNVIGDSPAPTPRVTPQPTVSIADSNVAARMEEITLPPAGPLQKSQASVQEIDETLNWSNEVIIPGEPTYSAQSVVPRFRTAEERNRAFREARRSSILNDDRLSKETLADVYVDWGNGAKAEDELKRLGLSSQETPEELIRIGEAYRLMGDLRTAEQFLKQATNLDPSSAPAFNALGNVYLDQAIAAQDRKDYARARNYLVRAQNEYEKALQAQPAKTPDDHNHAQTRLRSAVSSGKTEVVAYSNIGEVHLRLGEIARDEGNSQQASREYQAAEQAFGSSTRIDSKYQFAFKGLGDVYRETGELVLDSDRASADRYFARSQEQYVQAVRLHNDMAEAYVGQGRLLEDVGQQSGALNNYLRATQVRPELPDPHYYLAVALAHTDPRKAAEEARAYLRIERAPFKQGEKGKIARDVINHRPVPVRTVTPRFTPTPPPEDVFTPTPTPMFPPQPPARPVRVPNLKDKSTKDALKELTKRELVGSIQEKADCKASGKVLYTEPARDAMVAAGSTVTLFISSAGPDAVTLPDLRHRPKGDAEDELRRLGLTVRYDRPVQTNREQENNVVRQKPDPNKAIMRGCSVELTLAIPVPKVQVPNFVGLSRDEALGRLPRFSLGGLIRGNVSEVQRCDSTSEKVIDQRPSAGEWVEQGSSVDLVIAKCSVNDTIAPSQDQSQYVDVPDLRGMTEQQARNAIENSQGRFRLGTITYQSSGDCYKPVDRVIDQGPQPRQKVRRGTQINLVVLRSPIC